MWDNVIGRHIRRCNRNLLLVNTAILLALFVWAFSSERYLYNCLKGPFHVTHQGLRSIANANSLRQYFVSVDDLKPLETGLRYTETTKDKYTQQVKSQKVTATYFAAPLEDGILLIKSPAPNAASSYEGALISVPDEVRAYFQRELLDPKGRQFSEVFLPYLLDAKSFRTEAYWVLLFAFPLFGLAALNVRKAITRMSDVDATPISRSLGRFDQPPSNVAQMIDQDLKTHGDLSPIKSLCLTSSWLMRKSFFGLDVMHWSEVVWVYQKVTSHSYNFIPTGNTYAVIIIDKYGRSIEIDAGRWKAKEATSKLLQVLVSQMPWIAVGYIKELKQLFEQNRGDFVAAVQERRKQYSRAANT
jgi:hypothetical protein